MTIRIPPRSASSDSRPLPRSSSGTHDGTVVAFVLVATAMVMGLVEIHAALLVSIAAAVSALDAILDQRSSRRDARRRNPRIR